MEERNRNDQYIKVLQRLLSIVDEQNKTEYSEALRAAIKALQDQEDSPDRNKDTGDDVRLSGTPAEQLLQLAAQVRSTTLSPTARTQAAHKLARMSGGR